MNQRIRTCIAPSLRPLARGLMLALAALPLGSVMAGDLDGQSAEVVGNDPVEAWHLVNGSTLRVIAAETNGISASNSQVVLNGAVVNAGTQEPAVSLSAASSLIADTATLRGGGIVLSGTSSAEITNSVILVTAAAGLRPDATATYGVAFGSGNESVLDATAIIAATRIEVEDSPGAQDVNSGLGVRLLHGRMEIRSGSQIQAANIGAELSVLRAGLDPVLRIDQSSLRSGRGAAIHVTPRLDATFRIDVTNGSTLHGGNGDLLLVDVPSGNPRAIRTDVLFTVDDSRLLGNVRLDRVTTPNGTLDVTLRNKARIDGRFSNVTSAKVGTDSTWVMTGDSNVGRLQLDATGTVALGNGSSFNTLSVDEFVGDGGTLAFNTQLGDDTSATDKLVIAGDANGQANVRVFNAGGAGAKTNRGIELIDIGGASNAQFDLIGRAVGGQYEYFLIKDANGNWYLRSELATAPDPCLIDPTLPECGTIDPPVDPPIDPWLPILRPEAGAYLANQFALNQLLRHQWRDRQGGDTAAADGVRGWARVDSTQSKLGAVDDQLDLRVQRSRLQLGADVGVFDQGRGRVGLMATAAQSQAQSRSVITGYSARGKLEGGAIGAYGNWNTDALYVDASVQRGQFRNRVQGEGLGEERYDSDIWQSSLEAGYRFNIGQVGNTTLSLQPELQLVYTDASTDVHTESNGTIVRSLGDDGLSGRVGLRLQGESRATSGASVSPYLAVNWYRDAASNGMRFDDDILRADVPRNRYEVNAGGRVDFRSGLSGWGGLGVMRGDHGYREATANLGMSYRW